MVPQVMAGTNQYITMIASLVTVLQFILLKDLLWNYTMLFRPMTIVAAYYGLQFLNVFIARSGKQSVIAIVLAICLRFALLSLPLKYRIFVVFGIFRLYVILANPVVYTLIFEL